MFINCFYGDIANVCFMTKYIRVVYVAKLVLYSDINVALRLKIDIPILKLITFV